MRQAQININGKLTMEVMVETLHQQPSAVARNVMEIVRPKPLDWQDMTSEGGLFIAKLPGFGDVGYVITEDKRGRVKTKFPGFRRRNYEGTLEEAMTMCQEDWEDRYYNLMRGSVDAT